MRDAMYRTSNIARTDADGALARRPRRRRAAASPTCRRRTRRRAELLRDELRLPELSQLDVVRHFTRLSQLNWSIDTHMYPLGSCTMKLNPKVNDAIAAMPGFAEAHPMQPADDVQGALAVMYGLQRMLAEITGMADTSLAPLAGAQGELAGVLVIKAYLESIGEKRTTILVPDSAHGTNPATASMAGFDVVAVKPQPDGDMDLDALRVALEEHGPTVAALMITLPSTLGLFDRNIVRIAEMVHAHGAQMYGDGANLNAMLGQVKPGDLGFDVMHINLHKTFSQPHGGGGPGAGPIVVKEHLVPFLPSPHVEADRLAAEPAAPETYRLVDPRAQHRPARRVPRQLRRAAARVRVHPQPRRRRPARDQRGGGAERELRAGAAARRVRSGARPHVHARGAVLRPQAEGAGREDARHRQAA